MNKKLYDIKLENPINYEGKLNNHEEYIKMLNILEKTCKFIGIVSKHEIVEKFKDDIFLIEESSKWWTQISYKNEKIYYINATKELFDFLKKYETFCKSVIYKNIFIPRGTQRGERTNFGVNDIAFFDKDNNILLETVTHEGHISISTKIDKLYKNTNSIN